VKITGVVEDGAVEDGEEPRYGTRWRLMTLALVPALVVTGGVGAAMATGTLGVSFVAESGTLHLSTDGLQGDDLGITVVSVPTKDSHGHATSAYDVRIGVGSGKINGLCLSQRVGILGVPFTLLIKGGDADPSTHEIVADGLLLDVTRAAGVIAASGDLEVNKNGADVTLGSTGIALGGASDRFGLQASNSDLRKISATVRDISIPNVLTVPNFRVQVVPGDHPCPPPGSGTGPGS
jgi:hypothetical protein